MAAYYVLGIAFVVFALGLTAVGLTRPDFPPTRERGRAVIGFALVLALVTFGVLLASTEREHPREEATAEAAEKAAERGGDGKVGLEGEAGGQEAGAEQAQGGKITVIEDEYSIEIPSGRTLEAGPYTFEAVNRGKIDHDLAVQGPSVASEKTPLFGPGEREELEVALVPGEYKLYCSVPGHEQLGMKTEVTVE